MKGEKTMEMDQVTAPVRAITPEHVAEKEISSWNLLSPVIRARLCQSWKVFICNIKWEVIFFFKEDLKPWRLKTRVTHCWHGEHVISHYIGKRSLHFIGSCLICHKRWTGLQLSRWNEKQRGKRLQAAA